MLSLYSDDHVLTSAALSPGTWNLFVSGQQVKTWGPRTALMLPTSIPAIRVATQIIGVVTGGQIGIWIIQITQVITILGGPAGYM